MMHFVGSIECCLVILFDIFHCLYQESCTSHGRVADIVLWCRLHHFYYHADDMTRCAELTISARGCHFAKYILIHIAHGIAVVHIECIHTIYNLCKRASIWNQEYGSLHVSAIGALFASTDMLDKLEYILANHVVHILRACIAEHRPSHAFVWHFLIGIWIQPHLARRECRILYFAIEVACVVFFLQLLIVEHLHKKDVSHLLQYCDWIGDSSHKECVPYLVYLIFYFACYHILGISFIILLYFFLLFLLP